MLAIRHYGYTFNKQGNKQMLITKNKLEDLMEVMTTDKAKRAVSLWASNQGEATIDTLNALDDINDSGLIMLSKFIKVEMRIRGLNND